MDLDVDIFIKDMESIMIRQGVKDDNSHDEEGSSSSSDLDFGKIYVFNIYYL